MKRDLTEMNRLEDYLKREGIRYERTDQDETLPEELQQVFHDLEAKAGRTYDSFDRHQIIVYDQDGKRIWDVICQRGSFGGTEGLLEGWGNIFEGAEGHLTAQEVIGRIKENG